jgi:uncharacterized membrane protein YbhN (UPF0104 family)
VSAVPAADLSASLDAFRDAVQAFSTHVADIAWGYLAAALLLTLLMQLVRAHGWANVLRAAYPVSRVSETRLAGSFLVGAGLNGVLPAHGGDAVKIALAKRGIERSSYPTIISSLAVLAPFDAVIGAAVLLYAISQGLLPQAPQLPDLPAFEISYWAAHPMVLLLVLAGLGIGALVLFGVLARRVESFWRRFKLGFVILSEPGRYAREVVAWQVVAWVLRFGSFWLFLDAFHVGGSLDNVLLVMSVQTITNSLPLTPGGAGAQQALLVATLDASSRAALVTYSVGQQLAFTAWSLALAFLSLVLIFRTRDWRALVREGETARAEASAG